MSLTDFASKIAENVGAALDRRIGRRSFLSRTALVGTALAAAPATYVLRPQSAYAAVCNCSGSACDCGALCCDGYTEFCCTLTGRNACPPGTIAAGWWKADGSGFCGAGPRYYLDCNSGCGGCSCGGSATCAGSCSGTGCGCAGGSCGNRKAGCTRFRYGQCNQHIPCVGPIVCRVITCIAPWQMEPTCTTVSRTDNNTRFHDRPCLHLPFGSIDGVSPVAPGQVGVWGWMIDPDTTGPIDVHIYGDGTPLQFMRADDPRPDLASALPGYGVNHGFSATVSPPLSAARLCVYGINAGHGSGNPGPCLPIPRSPFGAVDGAYPVPGGLRVSGWAIDPDTTQPLSMHVYSGSRILGGGPANRNRPDIGRLYPGFGAAHGFDITVPAPPGVHRVCVYGLNARAGGTNASVGCRTVRVMSGSPIGRLDAASGQSGSVRVRGWAIDPDTKASVGMHIYVDGRFAGGGPANVTRHDVGRIYPGYGANHGFDLTVPSPRGSRQVCVYAINAGPGGNSPLGCRAVSVS